MMKIMALNDIRVHENEFRKLIAKSAYSLLTTRRAFHNHQCMKYDDMQSASPVDKQDIIDLTLDDTN